MRQDRRHRRISILPLSLALLALATAWAWGAADAQPGKTSGMGGSGEGIFVAEIILLLVVGRGLGELMERVGQPAVMGQLIGGILLGPSLFGWLWPQAQQMIFPPTPEQKSMIEAVSQLGILLLLLLTGMETDLRLVRRVGKACFSISAAGVAVPFVCGFILAQFLPQSLLPNPSERVVAGLFIGTALSISSVKIVAIIIREMGFMRRDLGQIIVSSAIIEDTVGWVIMAITFGIATNGSLEIGPLVLTIVEIAAFMAFSFTIGRRIVFELIRWANDTLKSEFAVITVILIVMGAMALTTNLIGVHTVLGAFVAGILVGESPILSDHIEAQLRGVITALFMPVFFGMAGLSADLTVLADPALLLLTAGLVVIASVGKFGGAFAGGELAGMSVRESTAVGCAMNARGSTEVIVASIGLSMGILSDNLFTMIVTMAVLTTLAMPPMLRWALRRLPMDPAERERVDREALDERGFVSRLERLLLAVDDSANGKFTAYLAGLIGGSSGMPTTVLRLARDAEEEKIARREERHLAEIKKGAKASAAAIQEAENTSVEKVRLTARTEAGPARESIAAEARKGYDMLLVGLGRTRTPKGAFTRKVNEVTRGFDGPLCLVARGAGKADKVPALEPGATILVPVNGTQVSRRAADLALAIARPQQARLKALYVSPRAKGSDEGASLTHRREEAALKDVAELAERYGVPIETSMRMRGGPAEAILREAAKGVALVVMGVEQRSGDELFFGDTATAVLGKVSGPVVLLSGARIRRDDAEKEAKRSAKSDSASTAKETAS